MESDTKGGAVNPLTMGYLSTFVTARLPTDPPGAMQPYVLVPSGKGDSNIRAGERIGDFSGLSYDPADGSFWHANEFASTSIDKTVIANFRPVSPLFSPSSIVNLLNSAFPAVFTVISGSGTPIEAQLAQSAGASNYANPRYGICQS